MLLMFEQAHLVSVLFLHKGSCVCATLKLGDKTSQTAGRHGIIPDRA